MILNEIINIIETYNLGKVVAWILENNVGQANPYHNFDHALCVMYHAHEAWVYTHPLDLL